MLHWTFRSMPALGGRGAKPAVSSGHVSSPDLHPMFVVHAWICGFCFEDRGFDFRGRPPPGLTMQGRCCLCKADNARRLVGGRTRGQETSEQTRYLIVYKEN